MEVQNEEHIDVLFDVATATSPWLGEEQRSAPSMYILAFELWFMVTLEKLSFVIISLKYEELEGNSLDGLSPQRPTCGPNQAAIAVVCSGPLIRYTSLQPFSMFQLRPR